MHVYFRR